MSLIIPSEFQTVENFFQSKDIYKSNNDLYTSEEYEELKLHTKYPSKSGFYQINFFKSSIVYIHKKNLGCYGKLNFINAYSSHNYSPHTEYYNNRKFEFLGHFRLYSTIIAKKYLVENKPLLLIKPFTKKYGSYMSQKTSQIIMKLVRFCEENNIYYIIDKINNGCITYNYEKIDIESECSICLETNNTDIIKTPCGHIFNRVCLKKWFETKNDCPLCRTKLY